MIEFMVLSAPRSASTWVSNWLTTEETLCIHDPLFSRHYSEIDEIPTSKRLGVACTGLALFPDWVNKHPARKVILHRQLDEVNRSLREIGLPSLGVEWVGALDRIKGVHVDWQVVFEHPFLIYEHLLRMPFDSERHAALRQINAQPNFERIHVNQEATARLLRELRSA